MGASCAVFISSLMSPLPARSSAVGERRRRRRVKKQPEGCCCGRAAPRNFPMARARCKLSMFSAQHVAAAAAAPLPACPSSLGVWQGCSRRAAFQLGPHRWGWRAAFRPGCCVRSAAGLALGSAGAGSSPLIQFLTPRLQQVLRLGKGTSTRSSLEDGQGVDFGAGHSPIPPSLPACSAGNWAELRLLFHPLASLPSPAPCPAGL